MTALHPPLLRPADVARAGRGLTAPFVLEAQLAGRAPELLPDGAAGEPVQLVCEEILRLLPGRRLVARAAAGGRSVVVKLFLGRGAERYRDRESRGCGALAAAGVATPALLGEIAARADEPPAFGLLFEYLADARGLSATDDEAVAAAAGALGRLHAAGFRHRDLHLDNFLELASGELFVIDGDGVVPARRGAVTEAAGLEELAVLCAQRQPLADARIGAVYRGYAAVRGWSTDDAEAIARLAAATRRQRRVRVRRFLAKAQRNCTEFHQYRGSGAWVVAVREAWDEALAEFAADPEAAFRHGEVLKAGNSATVIRVRLGSHTRVVKRYNLKGPWHALRRALTPAPRYRLAWLNGQRLVFLGIPTARPVALVERRHGPLRGIAYLVMEDLGDLDLGSEVRARGLEAPRVDQVAALFRALAAAGLVHGDTKASNFLVTPDRVHLVDLDALREAARGAEADVARFLANFDDLPEIRERFRAALAAADRIAPPDRPARSL